MKRDAFKKLIEKAVIQRGNDESPIIHRSGKRLQNGWLFDFRNVLLQSKWLDAYATLFWEKYADRYPFQVGGIESTGIALVAAVVMKSVERGTPVNGFFIRKSRKKDGLLKTVEGALNKLPVILVDDVINTGTSTMKQVLALADLAIPVSEAFCIVSFRDKDAYRFIEQHGVHITSLFTINDFGLTLREDRPAPARDPLSVLWHSKTSNPSLHYVVEKSAPVLDDTRVYVGSDSATLFALSQKTGEVVWTYQTTPDEQRKGIFSSPAIYEGVVFFGSYDGNVYALDTATGKPRWIYRGADWVGSSPSLAPERGILFIGLEFATPTERGAIVALSLETGEELWMRTFPDFVHCSPLYVRQTGLVYVGDNSGMVRAYEARSGEMRWERIVGGAVKSSFTYDATHDLVLFGAFDSYMYALGGRDGSVVFTYKTNESIFSTPLTHNDIAYVASLDKTLYAIHLRSGKLEWKYKTGGRIFSSPVLIEKSLWIGSNDGCLYEVEPSKGSVLSIQQVSERIVNKIAYNPRTRRLFVPTSANEVYCFERKAAAQ